MKVLQRAALAAFATVALTVPVLANDMAAMMPKPTPEHKWLQGMVGNWKTEVEGVAPDMTKFTSRGTDTVKPVGEFWVVGESTGDFQGMPFKGVMTTGYDAEKKLFVSTWVDNVSGKMMQTHGTVDPSHKVLTLEGEGKCPMKPDVTMRFRDVITMVDNNHREVKSYMQELGQNEWVPVMTLHATRVK